MLKNTPSAYGDIAKLFHWIIGPAIIAMLIFGFYIEGFAPEASRGALFGLHKSIGITILLLMAGRILWRFYTSAPHQIATHPKWEKALAVTIHYALYIAAFLMPLSGWLMSNAAGRAVEMFGIPIPALVDADPALRGFFGGAHSVLAWVLIGCISLHVLGALKHVFVDKDETLKRMLP